MTVRYTEEQKKKAVVTYWRLKSARKTWKKLGYPVDIHTLLNWVRERNKYGIPLDRVRPRTKEQHAEPLRLRDFPGTRRYSEEDMVYAVKMYWQIGSYSATVRYIGYPKRSVLSEWVKARYKNGKLKHEVEKPKREKNVYSEEQRKQVVEAIINDNISVLAAARRFNIANPAVIYPWIRLKKAGLTLDSIPRRARTDKGLEDLLNQQQKQEYPTVSQYLSELPDDVETLKKMLMKTSAELALLKEQERLKKEVGISSFSCEAHLTAKAIDAVRTDYPLIVLQEIAHMPASTFYYHLNHQEPNQKYEVYRPVIEQIAEEAHYTYGSYRIWQALKRKGIQLSEKVVRRLMKLWSIPVHFGKKKSKPYSNYVGEITPAPKDLLQHDFHATRPNEIWVTDISEFSCGEDKLYFSPIIDLFDGKVVSYQLRRNAHEELATETLKEAISTLKRSESVVLHSDRGGHYRAIEWIELCKEAQITRSMSRKGNSGDNAACEGFFGRMKNEMYYGFNWNRIEELEYAIRAYIQFHNKHKLRAKTGMTIPEYRAKLGYSI